MDKTTKKELIEVLKLASEHLNDHIDGLPPQIGIDDTKERVEALIDKLTAE